MSNRIFYIIFIVAIFACVAVGFQFNLNFKYWFACIGVLIFYLWIKDVITGTSLFGKAEPKTVKWTTPLASLEKKDYEDYVYTHYENISDTEKEGYLTLMKLCVSEELHPKLSAFFENIKDYSKDEDYTTTLNFVIDYFYEEYINFILNFDWKSDIENFEMRIKSSLKDNFNKEIDLPDASDYDERASISHDHLFEDFDIPLRQNGFQIGFIDTESDEYMIVIHQIIDKEKVGNAVNKMGYKYFEK